MRRLGVQSDYELIIAIEDSLLTDHGAEQKFSCWGEIRGDVWQYDFHFLVHLQAV